MKAAVVSSFDTPPRYGDVPAPEPAGPDELLVDVVAAGLHPRVLSQADGSHYTSTGALPLVPGVDGVGRGPDGLLRYFILPDTTLGSMAEQTVVDARRSVVLPEDTDAVAVAAGMNPGMSAWVALRQRVEFAAGGSVLVLGATGNAGRLAVQVARRLGAGRVVAAARVSGADDERLTALTVLGATETLPLDDDRLGPATTDVDVVLDYLWGEPAARAMVAMVTARADRSRPLRWIQIGSVAGPTAAVPSAALRASGLQIVGSGQGSVSTAGILAELPALAREITDGELVVDARPVPLAEIETVWAGARRSAHRLVITP